jgi:pimeloyl-ACP methyl ester carboxylesterase
MVRPGAVNAWVLLRGLTREARHWGKFPEALQAAFPGVRVVTPDLPGFGARRDLRSPTRIEQIMESVREELRRSGVEFPVGLVGLSLGAMVATEWASRHPGEVGACVLVNTSLAALSPIHRRLRPGNYLRLARIALSGLSGREKESGILALTSNVGDPEGRIVEEWAAIRRESPVSRGNTLRQLLAAARYRGGASAPAVPVLVLASEGDRLVDPECSRAIATRWKADIAWHPTAGHDLPLDDGEWVAGRIRDWLGGARERPTASA